MIISNLIGSISKKISRILFIKSELIELEQELFNKDNYVSTVLLNLVNILLSKFENRKYLDVNSYDEEFTFLTNCSILNHLNHCNEISEKKEIYSYLKPIFVSQRKTERIKQ